MDPAPPPDQQTHDPRRGGGKRGGVGRLLRLLPWIVAAVLIFLLIQKRNRNMAERTRSQDPEPAVQVTPEQAPVEAPVPTPFDPAFVLPRPHELAKVPTALRFDHPLGSERGALTYNAQPFLENRHLGDDLNGIGGWNSDLGDPVYAAGRGRVLYAGKPSDGWGNMVILAHRVPVEGGGEEILQTVYAHLQKIDALVGENVARGEKIGTVGTAEGNYLAHLHFELRASRGIGPGAGYDLKPLGRRSPEAFLDDHRPPDPGRFNRDPGLAEGGGGGGVQEMEAQSE